MATFEKQLDGSISPKDIQRKFNAFVELYGESDAFLVGDFNELTSFNNLLPLFNINAKIVKIGNKYIDVIQNGAKARILIPSVDQSRRSGFGVSPKIKFISYWIN